MLRDRDEFQFPFLAFCIFILGAVVHFFERTEALGIEAKFLAVNISRVGAVQQFLEQHADFPVRSAGRRVHHPTADENGPNSISAALNGKVYIIFGERTGEPVIHTNNLLSNLHNYLISIKAPAPFLRLPAIGKKSAGNFYQEIRNR